MNLERHQIEQLVRIVIAEVLEALGTDLDKKSGCSCNGDCPCSKKTDTVKTTNGAEFTGRLLSENHLNELLDSGCSVITLSPGCIITPLARDLAKESGIRFQVCDEEKPVAAESGNSKCLAVIAGRCSNSEENALIETANSCGWKVRIEEVTGSSFKDLANTVRKMEGLITSGQCQRAVILDENIFRISQLLNSGRDARPAICWDEKSAIDSRCQSECNFLLISNRLLGLSMLGKIVRAWLKEE